LKKLSLIFILLIFSCKQVIVKKVFNESTINTDLTLAFGSCNNQAIPNILFKEIIKNKPKVFIWGGDIIYSDTNNPDVLAKNYTKFKLDSAYQNLKKHVEIMGTWDDHDYSLNDGGVEHKIKAKSQQLLLDFLDVPKDDKRRVRKGVYNSKIIEKDSNSVKIITLDTRYFRTHLTPDKTGKKRYILNNYGEGTMLGDKQWKWLENELLNSTANFNVIVSSIQFLSNKHGFESWGNMPHEVDKLKKVIIKTNAKNVIILSGDRHISEISKTNIGKYNYPLIDFTSSGLTHAYTSFTGEQNPYRVSNVIYEINFGLLKFDFKNNKVLFEIRGKNNAILEQFIQDYR
jgi:alkaline phosphatase D